MQLRRVLQAVSAALLAISLAACSAAATPAPTAPPRAAPSAASPAVSVAPAGSLSVTVKVNANTASQDEIAAALKANGVINPANWAKEVVEYRPYPTNDPTLRKLQDNLVKYRPDPATVAGILATLEP